MNLEIWKWVGTLGISLLVAVVTSWVSVRLALKRFYSEKWWERKLDAYCKVMDSLVHMRPYHVDAIYFLERNAMPTDDETKEAEQVIKQAHNEINKASLGGFIISQDAADCLNTLRNGIDRDHDPNNQVEVCRITINMIDTVIENFGACGRKDLGLNTGSTRNRIENYSPDEGWAEADKPIAYTTAKHREAL